MSFKTRYLKTHKVAATDPVRYQLNGIHVRQKGGQLDLTATDGKVLARVSLNGQDEDSDLDLILPNETAKESLRRVPAKYQDTVAEISKHPSVLTFGIGGEISFEPVDGIYPDADSVFNEKPRIGVQFDIRRLKQIIDTLISLAGIDKKSNLGDARFELGFTDSNKPVFLRKVRTDDAEISGVIMACATN